MIIDYVLSQAVGPVLAPADTTRLKLSVQDKDKFRQHVASSVLKAQKDWFSIVF